MGRSPAGSTFKDTTLTPHLHRLHRTNTPELQTGLSGHNDILVIKQAIDLEKLPRDPSWGPREEPLVKQNSLLEESRNNRNVIYISV